MGRVQCMSVARCCWLFVFLICSANESRCQLFDENYPSLEDYRSLGISAAFRILARQEGTHYPIRRKFISIRLYGSRNTGKWVYGLLLVIRPTSLTTTAVRKFPWPPNQLRISRSLRLPSTTISFSRSFFDKFCSSQRSIKFIKRF